MNFHFCFFLQGDGGLLLNVFMKENSLCKKIITYLLGLFAHLKSLEGYVGAVTAWQDHFFLKGKLFI